MPPDLIIVTGPPATGKTTLARDLAHRYRLPLVYKDAIKERLFDQLGWRDREWSRQLGRASYDLLYYFVEVQLTAGRSAIVESNFYPAFDTAKFAALARQYPFRPIQIYCHAPVAVILDRYRRRVETGERHPGHVDAQNYAEIRAAAEAGRNGPLDLGGPIYRLDVSDFAAVDRERLYSWLAAVLAASAHAESVGE